MDVEKSIYEDDDTNCYQISDDDQPDYGNNDESANNSDTTSQFTRGPYERAWTTEATRALIHIRGPMEDEFSEGRAKRTLLWIQVTKQLHKMGYRYSAAKVQKKWHNILITYNKNITKKEESGTVSWDFFEDMYIYLKGKKAKTFEYSTDLNHSGKKAKTFEYSTDFKYSAEFSNSNSSMHHKVQHSQSNHHMQMQKQMQHQHQMIQRQKLQNRQRLEQSRHYHSKNEKTDKVIASTPGTSQDFNDNSNNNDELPMIDEEEQHNRKRNNDDTKFESKSKKRQLNDGDGYFLESSLDRLPLEISHVEGGTNDEKYNNLENGEEHDPFYESDWWKDYFNRKLETEREKIDIQKQIHRDVMNYNKMCLIQQEKIERIKIEAINNLTVTLQKLVEVKSHKKI